ncbi:heparinase II/III family protein [Antribacter gilvus]|uniref:heparinase II/III family protein n=1 Tax=Antribacter gilvus TaxID=2304675 RepID=UPI000F7A9AB2|nr:heparinase II/III family protein [Antribacter gilvus]
MTDAATVLPAPTVADRGHWDAPRVVDALADVVAQAEAERGSPWPQPLTSHYARFFRDGDRTEYENLVAARQARLTRAVLTTLRTPEDRWVDEVVDGVVLLCEQSSWCWAAHDDTFTQRGRITPTVTDPYLDLGAGEVAAQLAWTDHLLGPLLDARAPGVRERVRTEAATRVLRPFTDRRDWWWLGVDHPIMNWSPWIQGNVLAAALALEPDPARRDRTVSLVAEGLDAYWASLPADGGVDEGYQYWWQGAARALEAQDLLDRATGTPPSEASLAVIRATVAFPHAMHLGDGWYVNVADGTARPAVRYPWNVVRSWAARLGDDAAARHAASYREAPGILLDERSSLPRAVTMLSDDAWAATAPASPPLVAAVWLPQTEVALARQTAGTAAGLAVSVKGGHNDENHNHDDVGNVVVALDGVPVVVDAGLLTYTAATFGPDRYSIWSLRADWHNVPRVRDVEQPPGRERAARDMAVYDGPGTWRVRLDLAPAYPGTGLERWWREVALDRASGRVTVEDSWTFAEEASSAPGGRTAWHWVLAGEVALGEGRATARHGERPLRLTWDAGVVEAALDVQELDDPLMTEVWGDRLTRLRLTLRAESPRGTFCVTMGPPDPEELR